MKISHNRFKSFLVPLRKENIEQVRLWRNQQSIKKWMEFQDSISKEEQREWFNNLKDTKHHYFEIWHYHQFIGLIYLKFLKNRQAYEAGLFLGNEKFHGTGAGIEASVLLLKWSLDNDIKPVLAKVHKNHKNAILYNQYLGFKTFEEEETFFWMLWDKNLFLNTFNLLLS